MSYAAIEEFYKENWDDLIRRNTRKCGGVENAEDVVQEAFTRCLEGVDTFDSQRGDLGRWIVRALTNTFIDFKRQERARGMGLTVSLTSLEDNDVHFLEDGFDKKIMIDNLVDKTIRVKSPKTHKKLIQHYKLGYSVREIREVGGSDVWSLRATTQRIRKNLKEKHSGKVRIRHRNG